MIIGNPDRFGVKFEIDLPYEHWLFGRMCYIVHNQCVGNYENGASLAVAINGLTSLMQFSGARNEESLITKPAADVFTEIDNALYLDRGQSDGRVARDRTYYWRFHAKPTGFDVFDHWKCYLVEDERVGRFLWVNLRDETKQVHEQQLARGEFDAVILSFLQYVRTNYQDAQLYHL
jgi:hypothetical protein